MNSDYALSVMKSREWDLGMFFRHSPLGQLRYHYIHTWTLLLIFQFLNLLLSYFSPHETSPISFFPPLGFAQFVSSAWNILSYLHCLINSCSFMAQYHNVQKAIGDCSDSIHSACVGLSLHTALVLHCTVVIAVAYLFM